MAVFITSLSIVVLFAEGLPVGLIPEQRRIPTMGSDVVNDRGCSRTAFVQAHYAKRMLCKVFLAGTLPL